MKEKKKPPKQPKKKRPFEIPKNIGLEEGHPSKHFFNNDFLHLNYCHPIETKTTT